MLELESSIERILCVFPSESAKEVWPHTRVQVLADLERDFDFFREWRRDMLGYLILCRIETRVGQEISDAGGRRTILYSNPPPRPPFTALCFNHLFLLLTT